MRNIFRENFFCSGELLLFIFLFLVTGAFAAEKPILWKFKEIIRQQPAPLPELTDKEKQRGFLLFTNIEPGEIYDRSVPAGDQIVDKIETFATPGEVADINFALHGLRDLKDVKVHVADFSQNELGNAHWQNDVRIVQCWSQRTGWKSSTFHIIPELLLKNDAVKIKQGYNQQYYLRVKIPVDAVAGKYQAKVSVSVSGKSSQPLILQIEVLAFKLLEPKDIIFGLYPDYSNWQGNHDDKLRMMKKIRAQGINAMMMYPLRHSQWEYRQGKVVVDMTDFNRWMEMYKSSGMQGPFVMSIQGVGRLVRKWTGDKAEQDFSAEGKNALEQIVKIIADQSKKNDWPAFVFHAVDEPSDGEKMKEAVRICKIIHEMGYNTFSTIWDPGPLDPYLDYRCYCMIAYSGLKDKQITAKKRKETLDAGDVFWYYGTGCYVNGGIIQDGNIIANRYMGGTFLWRSGATGCWSWTLMRPRDDVFNDFDGGNEGEPKDQMTVYPPIAGDQDFTPTLQWEGIRKGIDDYRYIYTLSKWIGKAKKSSDSKLAAKAASIEKQLDQMIDSMAWRHAKSGQYPAGAITNANLEQNRKRIADWIMQLLSAGYNEHDILRFM